MKCPLHDAVLLRYSFGRDIDLGDGVADHIDSCVACQGRLKTVSGNVRSDYEPSVLSDRYELLKSIGRGGMGEVWLAWDRRGGRGVALKLMNPDRAADPAAHARFAAEYRNTAAIDDPNVVRVYDFEPAPAGVPFYTMEYASGQSLERLLIDRQEVYAPAEAARVVLGLAQAIEAAHGHGVIHRDVKPANVLVSAAGEVKVVDFGISSRAGPARSQTLDGGRPGSIHYMSPDRLTAPDYRSGPADDIYSLGVLLHNLLTLSHPVDGGSTATLRERIQTATPVRPSTVNPRVGPQLEAVCLKCLEKDPAARYASAALLAEDLGRYLRLEPVHAVRASRSQRAALFVKRNRKGIRLGGISAVVLVATTVAVLLLASDAATRQARADTRRAVDEATGHLLAGRYDVADTSLAEAKRRAQSGRPERDLAADLAGVESDLRTGKRMRELVKGSHVRILNQTALNELSDGFMKAFAEYGADFTDAEPDEAAVARLDRSSVRSEIAAALDRWLCLLVQRDRTTTTDALRARVDAMSLRLERREPVVEARRAAAAGDIGKLKALSASPTLADWPPFVAATAVHVLIKSGDAPAAKELAAKVWQLQPDRLETNLALGELYAVLLTPPEPGEAVPYYTTAVGLDRENPTTRINLGTCLSRLPGRAGDAEQAFRSAVALAGDNHLAHYNLGLLLLKRGDPESAAQHLEQASRASPGDPLYWHQLGEALQQSGRLGDAVAAYQQAEWNSRQFPQWPHASALHLKDCQTLIALEPHLGELLAGRLRPATASEKSWFAWLCALKGRHAKAYELYEPVLQTGDVPPGGVALERIWAAGAAVQLSMGAAGVAAPLTDDQKKQLRVRALGWLTANLTQWKSASRDINGGRRRDTPETLNRVLSTPSLAVTRTAVFLETLDASEQQSWQSFWSDVATLLDRPTVWEPAGLSPIGARVQR